MEKRLLGNTKPITLEIVHVVDLLLQFWFPWEMHTQLGWYVNTTPWVL